MRTRTTRSGLPLTELGLGVSQFGNLYRPTSDEDAAGAFDAAWEGGIRYFDTAPHYGLGLSERRLGALLRTRPREDFIVSSKVGRLLVPTPENAHQLDPEGFVVPASFRREWDFSREGIFRSVEQTLARTGLDHVDILYLHDPDEHFSQASTEGIDALIELREQGVVKAVGAGMNQSDALVDLIRIADVDLVMLAGRFSLLDQSAASLLDLALERRIGVVVAGVYNSGLLSSSRPQVGAKYDYSEAPRPLVDRANAIADICERNGVSLPTAALAFPLLHPAVISVVVGARTAVQSEGNIKRYSTEVPSSLWPELSSAGLLSATSHTRS